MHTEEDARKLWCPFSRLVVVEPAEHRVLNSAAYNRLSVEDTDQEEQRFPLGCRCIASDCMAWRWGKDATYHRDAELWSKSKNKRVTVAWDDDADWRPVGGDADAEPPLAKGYCGLAGAPQ